MGMSTSFFTCGCKLPSNQPSNKSKKSLLSNGSLVAGVSNHPSENNLIVSENNSSDNNTTSYHTLPDQSRTNSTNPWFQEMDSPASDQNSVHNNLESMGFQIGSMQIKKPQFKALIVFSKNDDQFQAWNSSLNKLGFQCDIANSEETALNIFNETHHHVVIIENQNKKIEADSLCRSLRRSAVGGYATIVGVMARYKIDHGPVKLPCFLSCNFYKRNQVDEISKTRELLNAGFDRIIAGTSNAQEVEDELTQLEVGPLAAKLKLRSIQAVFAALERSRDLIQITDSSFQIQYVNRTYEHVTGFKSDHVIGTNLSWCFENEKNEEDTWERIKEEVQRGKNWDGLLHTKRHDQPDLQLQVSILPLSDQTGSAHQYVVVSQGPGNNAQLTGKMFEFPRKQSSAGEQFPIRRSSIASVSLGEGDGSHKRTNSLARIHSMAVEAPITQIINLISDIKESSQPGVNDVLDQILEILRNSELYAPADFPNRSRDPMLSDFVDGLVTGTGYNHRRSSGGASENLFGRTPPSHLSAISSAGGFRTVTSLIEQPSLKEVDPNIARCLEGSDSWDYDVLALERISVKKPLVHLGMHILNQFDICSVLECSQNTLYAWLVGVESHYRPTNCYHNSTHAADVLHATAYFLKKERVQTWMEPLDHVAALLAAIVHDVDHPGRTNAFLVNSNDPLALLYNDTAVLESHHVAFTFKFTFNNESCNIFKNMNNENFRTVRQSMIDMVLATELSKHFEHVNKFISIVTMNNGGNSPLNEQDPGSNPGNRASGALSPAATHELKILIKRMLIKVADVINPARKTEQCVEWARRISEEYFSQTDEEKRRGLPVVMPHFDRKTCSLPKSQMTFIDYFLTDMFEAWNEFCGLDDVMANLNGNYAYWENLRERGVMRLAELGDDLLLCHNHAGAEDPGDDAVDAQTTCVENHRS